jgi:hypothetical protein
MSEERLLKGKFRHANKTVWCPKPKSKIITNTDLKSVDFLKETVKQCKYTGWQNIDCCLGCPYLEEFDCGDDGVFCLYPKLRCSLSENKTKERTNT